MTGWLNPSWVEMTGGPIFNFMEEGKFCQNSDLANRSFCSGCDDIHKLLATKVLQPAEHKRFSVNNNTGNWQVAYPSRRKNYTTLSISKCRNINVKEISTQFY